MELEAHLLPEKTRTNHDDLPERERGEPEKRPATPKKTMEDSQRQTLKGRSNTINNMKKSLLQIIVKK